MISRNFDIKQTKNRRVKSVHKLQKIREINVFSILLISRNFIIKESIYRHFTWFFDKKFREINVFTILLVSRNFIIKE